MNGSVTQWAGAPVSPCRGYSYPLHSDAVVCASPNLAGAHRGDSRRDGTETNTEGAAEWPATGPETRGTCKRRRSIRPPSFVCDTPKVETVYIPCPMCATKKDDRALFSVRTKDGHHCMLCEDTGVARVGRLRVPDHG